MIGRGIYIANVLERFVTGLQLIPLACLSFNETIYADIYVSIYLCVELHSTMFVSEHWNGNEQRRLHESMYT